MARRKMSEEQVQAMVNQYQGMKSETKKGGAVTSLAATYGVSPQTIYHHLQAAGIYKPRVAKVTADAVVTTSTESITA